MNIHILPDSVTDEAGVFIEPLAAAFEIMRQIHIKPDDKVCVLGDGRLGMLVAQAISLTGCDLIVLGKHIKKLSVLEKKGIQISRVSSYNQKKEFDVVVDCTGSPSGFDTARSIVISRGVIVMKTTVAARDTIDLNSLVIDEISLIGSRCGPFTPAIRALHTKKIDVIPLISKVYSLNEAEYAFRYAAEKDVLKIIFNLSSMG